MNFTTCKNLVTQKIFAYLFAQTYVPFAKSLFTPQIPKAPVDGKILSSEYPFYNHHSDNILRDTVNKL